MERIRARYERKYTRLSRKALGEQINPVFVKLSDIQDIQSVISTLDVLITEESILKLYNGLYSDVGTRFANDTFEGLQQGKKYLKKEFSNDAFILASNEYVNIIGGTKIVGITNETRKRVRKELEKGIEQGYSIDEMAVQLSKRMQQINVIRGIRIARTEVISASNFGSLKGAMQVDDQMLKIWMPALDKRTRDGFPERFDHLSMSGKSGIELNAAFNVSGEDMMFPGDSSFGASAGNIINCRCAIGYERKV